MKNYIKSISILFVLFLLVFSCQHEEMPVTVTNSPGASNLLLSNQVGNTISAKAQQQLKDIFTFWSKNFPDADLQPVGIEEPNKITSEIQRQAIMDKTLAPESHYAFYDGENLSSMKVFKVSDMHATFARANIETMNSRLQVGHSYATFKWKYKGAEFSTLYVYDENGFVYEPITASIAIKKDNIDPGARTNWIQNFDILWVWGGRRGQVQIKHTSTCSGTRLKDHAGWSFATMSLGSAQADIIANGSSSTKGSASWGYSWGTPGIKVSVSTDWGASGTYQGVSWNGKVNASASGVLGSSGKATGFDMIGC